MHRHSPRRTRQAPATAGTLRLRLLKIGARVTAGDPRSAVRVRWLVRPQKSYLTRASSILPISGAPTNSRCRLFRILFAVRETCVLGWNGSR